MSSKRPNAVGVAARARVLKAVVSTAIASVEQRGGGVSADEVAAESRRRRAAALAELGAAVSPWEREYFEAATLSRRHLVDAGWRLEALQILLWALGLLEPFPPCEDQASLDILDAVPLPASYGAIRLPRLRPAQEIDRRRDIAEIWHWRSRTRRLIEQGEPFPDSPQMRARGYRSYDDVVRVAAAQAAADGDIPSVDGDFGWGGKAYRDLSEEEWSQARSIAVERHYALNWLCGYAAGNEWDETPTDT